MRLAVFLLAAVLSFPSLADGVPEKGEGTVTILGGARYLPNGTYINEQGASHKLLQPGILAQFGYMPDDELHFKIDLGYGVDRYLLSGGSQLTVHTTTIMLGIDTVLARGSWFTFYAGGGVGYLLNTGTRAGVSSEANATGAYLAVGFRARLTDHVAAVIEERYTLASAAVDQTSSTSLVVGGNFISLGLLFHFLSPDDKGHPQGPAD